MSTDSLTEILKRLASNQIRPDDLSELQEALSFGQVTIASDGGIVIRGNVSGGTITSTTIKLPSEFLKLLPPAYQPPALPFEKKLAERGPLPPGSRLSFAPNAVFTGREEDLKDLAYELLYADETPAAVVVTGYGGVGKSQLAVEFCYRYGRFFQGVHWIQANQDMLAEVADCGRAMGLPCWPDKLPDQAQTTLFAWQNNNQRLILLDSAEDLKALQDWLPKLQPARVLITSLRENWPMDLGLQVRKLEVLTRTQSKELLCKLAARLKKQPAKDLDTLARYLGDLPLALDLAGRYLLDRSELSIEGYLSELSNAGNALKHTSLKDWAEHSPTKHATSLAATFALSWNSSQRAMSLRNCYSGQEGTVLPTRPYQGWCLQKHWGQNDWIGMWIGRYASWIAWG